MGDLDVDRAPEEDPAVSALTPFVVSCHIQEALEFYGALGFEIQSTYQPDGHSHPVWAHLSCRDANIMLAWGQPIDPGAQGVTFYMYAEDLRGLRDHLIAKGLTPGPIVDGSPGPSQELEIRDPDGYRVMIAQIE